jgi:hypothetical protein
MEDDITEDGALKFSPLLDRRELKLARFRHY